MRSIAHYGRLLSKAIQLAGTPVWRRGLINGVAATVEHNELQDLITPSTILDIGANKGQFTLFALAAWPRCKVIAFEPLPRPASVFSRVTRQYPNVHLLPTAIGPTPGYAHMNLSMREDSSSLLRIDGEIVSVFPEARASGATQAVRVARLDGLLNQSQLKPPVLAKLDVQGFELAALQSFGVLMNSIDYLYIECSYIHLYEDQPLIDDILDFMQAAGFRKAAELNLTTTTSGAPVQSDCLFIRSA